MHLVVATKAPRNHRSGLRVVAWFATAVTLAVAGVDVALSNALLIPLGWTLVSVAAAILAAPLLRAMADDDRWT